MRRGAQEGPSGSRGQGAGHHLHAPPPADRIAAGQQQMLGEFYNKGVRDMKELVLTLFGDALDLSDTNLLSDSTPPLGLAPQPPQDDQN